MEKILWDDKYNIGVEIVDQAHAKLFRIIKKISDVSRSGETNPSSYLEGIKYLETYSMTHFLEEEEYMRSIRYQGYAHHKRIHDNFRTKTLPALKKDLELSGYSDTAVSHFVSTMINWLSEHIMKEDQAIVKKDVSRKSYDLSSQIPIISRAVNQSAKEIFQTNAKLVNSDYKGQNIGDGFYCRHYYDTDNGLRLQILLGVEKPLLLRGASWIQGRRLTQENELAPKTLFLIFSQLYQNLGNIFKIESRYPLERKNMLDTEGFRAEFMKKYPCSLLFNTKFGYFIFCYRTWRIKTQKAADSEKKEAAYGS